MYTRKVSDTDRLDVFFTPTRDLYKSVRTGHNSLFHTHKHQETFQDFVKRCNTQEPSHKQIQKGDGHVLSNTLISSTLLHTQIITTTYKDPNPAEYILNLHAPPPPGRSTRTFATDIENKYVLRMQTNRSPLHRLQLREIIYTRNKPRVPRQKTLFGGVFLLGRNKTTSL